MQLPLSEQGRRIRNLQCEIQGAWKTLKRLTAVKNSTLGLRSGGSKPAVMKRFGDLIVFGSRPPVASFSFNMTAAPWNSLTPL